MRFAELDAVTVDGFGTLVTLGDPTAALTEALARHGAALAPSAVAAAFRAEVQYYRPRALEGRDAASLARLREQCAAVFLDAAGAAIEPAAFADDFVGALEFDLVPGALEAIRSLRARGLDVAVVANWDASLSEHLERLGASAYVSAVVTSASAGAAKPDPAIFDVALERLRVPAARALHVGDEPLDEEGARAAGMRFLAAPLATAFRGVDVSDVQNERSVTNGKLAGWLGLVVALSTIAYASRAAGGAPDSDVLYKYSTAISALVQYAVMLGLIAAISVGLRREELGLRPPFRLGPAIGLAVVVLVATDFVGLIVDQFANPGKEQGLTPQEWDPSRAAPFVVNFVVVVAVAPCVEELMFRGLGYRVLEPFGRWAAILGVGLAFALVHGLISGFVILFFFGAALAWLRSETGSIYPGIGVHALFNAIALVLAVTT